jgi:hypothetical protein
MNAAGRPNAGAGRLYREMSTSRSVTISAGAQPTLERSYAMEQALFEPTELTASELDAVSGGHKFIVIDSTVVGSFNFGSFNGNGSNNGNGNGNNSGNHTGWSENGNGNGNGNGNITIG